MKVKEFNQKTIIAVLIATFVLFFGEQSIARDMKAPVVKANKYGFISELDLPTKMNHLKVVVTGKDHDVTAKIYYDGKLLQTFKELPVGPIFEPVHYLDANFDGYVDILIGHAEARADWALLVWDSHQGRFLHSERGYGRLLLQPSTKMMLGLGFSSWCSNYYYRYKLIGSKLTEIDYLEEITDPNQYKQYGVKNRYTLRKRRHITSSTSSKSKLPQEWRQILKGYDVLNAKINASGY